ncbi:MAG: ExbD/TolR family protein [Bacteriovoracia bacterium]
MPRRLSIRDRRGRKNLSQEFDLQLTSLLDVMVIILVFMLKSATVSTNTFLTAPGVQLPISGSQDFPAESVHLIVTPEAILFENARVVDFAQSADAVADQAKASQYKFQSKDLDEGGKRILPLYDALLKAKEKDEFLRTKSRARDEQGNPLPFEGVLAIQADKHVNYEVLRKVMYTAASAGYKVFNFLAMNRDRR